MSRVFLNKVYNRTEFYGCVHPLGIMYLAAMLRDRQPGQHEIKLHDMILRREPPEETLPKILEFEPDVVGLSTMTHEASVAHELARLIKAERPGTKVILGGPYTSANPEAILENRSIDYLVVGEGEFTFNDLIRELGRGNENPDLNGVAYLKGGDYIWKGPCVQSDGEVLDSIPFPAWDLIDHEAYYNTPRFSNGWARREYMSLFTSRGCPYQCTYCHEIFTKKFHAHSPERVLAEIDTIVENYGVGELCIVDDIFNIDVRRAQQICEMIIERGYDFKLEFPNGVRADLMTYDLLKTMKAAGTYRFAYAVETASPRLQRYTKKNVRLPKMEQAIDWADELGIFVNGFFMLGFPTETREELQATVDYACDSKLHTANFFTVNPFEGTKLSDQVAEMGIEVNTGETDNFNYFNRSFQLSEMDATELTTLIRKANWRFYTRPWRLMRIIQLLPNKRFLPLFVVLFVIRTMPFVQSQREGQKYLDITFRVQAWFSKTWSRFFPTRHLQRRIFLAKKKKEREQMALAAATPGSSPRDPAV